MNIRINALAAAVLLTLAACGGQGDDSLGDNVADQAAAQADDIEAAAENTSNEAQADLLEAKAENVEEAGEAKEEAIDDADVKANRQ